MENIHAIAAPEHESWEEVGGHPVLDFVNTVHDWTTPERRDYLQNFEDLLDWCQQAGLIGAVDRRSLAAGNANGKASAMVEARALRESLHAVFQAVARGTALPQAALNDLNSLVRKTVAWRKLAVCNTGDHLVMPSWDFNGAPANALLGPIVWQALDLLENGPMDRIKECPPPEGCGWLFVDTSKNRSRQWCSMKTCGNLSKVRRFRDKRRD